MLKINRPKEVVAATVLVLLYACLTLAYLTFLDAKFYVKNIFNCGIIFAIPIPYIVLVAIFICLYSYLLRQKWSVVAYPIIAMAVILPLFYLLTDMKIGMRAADPFGGNRGIYGIYALAYFTFLISLFSLLGGVLFRKLSKKEMPSPLAGTDSEFHNFILHLPVFIYIIYIIGMLFLRGLAPYGVSILVFFFLGLFYGKMSFLLQKAKVFLVRLVTNERLFLLTIFIIAFLIRYFWGVRLLGITGENFIIASDDGLCYDNFASIFAQGDIIPRNTMSGFGYWYFLGVIYKIFGLHNFKAMFTIQSFIGAFVPVLTYFIGKKIFKTRLAPAVASIMTSLDMTLIFLSVVIGMEAIYIPLVFLALLIAEHVLGARVIDYRKVFLVGAAFGLAYLARPPELLLFPFVLAFIIYIFARKRFQIIKMPRIIISLFIGFILLVSVLYVSDYVLYGKGPNLQGGAVASFHAGIDEGGHTDENKTLGQMGFSPFENLKGSISVFMRKPITVSKLIIKGFSKRLIILYFLPNFGVFDPAYLVNPGSGYFFRFPIYVQFCGYLLVLVGICTVFLKRENFVGPAILFVFLLYMSIRVALFFVLNSRYRGVLIPILVLFFAYGAELFYKKVKYIYGKEIFRHAN